MTSSAHDTQRDLERRALRNVRGLVDKMESAEQGERHTQRRVLVVLAVIVVALAAALGWAVYRDRDGRGARAPVVIDPAKLPPIRPGPAR